VAKGCGTHPTIERAYSDGGFWEANACNTPAALVKINAESALAFAEAGRSEVARLQIELMDGIPEGAAHVGKIAELVLTPARRRIQEQVRNAKESGDENPSDAITAARELLEHTQHAFSVRPIHQQECSIQKRCVR
jgi:hypothetical protein